MMFQGYLERGFVAEDGDIETLAKLLGHPPDDTKTSQRKLWTRGDK